MLVDTLYSVDPTVAQLLTTIGELNKTIRQLNETISELTENNGLLADELADVRQKLLLTQHRQFGRSSEKLDPNQY